MKTSCLLDKRGKKLLKRLKRKPLFREKRNVKLQLIATRISIFSSIVALILASASLTYSIYSTSEQVKFNRETVKKDSIQQAQQQRQHLETVYLMNNYVSITDSLRAITYDMLKHNRIEFQTQLEKNKSFLEVFINKAFLDSSAINENFFFPSFEFTIKNVGLNNANNSRFEALFFGSQGNTFFKSESELFTDVSIQSVMTLKTLPKISIKNKKVFYVIVNLSWYDKGLEKNLNNPKYWKISNTNNKLNISLIDIEKEFMFINELARNLQTPLNSTQKELQFIHKLYSVGINYTEMPPK